MTDTANWYPPPTYFTTGTYGPPAPEKFRCVTSIDGRLLTKPDGTKYLRFQVPEAPIKIASLTVGGYLRSTIDGLLLNPANVQAGIVDFDTGIFEVWVDYDLAPGLGSREITYVYPRPV